MTSENSDGKQTGRRWTKGVSGNPAGKPKGARHRATMAAQVLLDGEAETLTRKCIDLALAGDSTALRLCMERIAPAVKSRPIRLSLPAINTSDDVLKAQAIAIKAMAAGDITPDEAVTIASVLEAKRKAIETVDIEARLSKLEQAGERK